MGSVSTLIKCGFVQICCAVSLLLFKILDTTTYKYKETLHLPYQEKARQQLFHRSMWIVDVAAIFLYAVTGILLMCLSSRTKNFCLILIVNISTLLSLLAASGLFIFALDAILSGSSDQPAILLEAIVVLVNSLVMLTATMVSTLEIWRISFNRSNSAIDSQTNIHVSGTNPSGAPRSRIQVANERNTRSSQPFATAEDDLFQYFTTDGSEAEENGDAPPPYHIATGTIPCKHCRFTAKNKNDFVKHFQRRPDHWSCLACKKGFTTFKDFYRHIVRKRCNRSNGQNGIVTKMHNSLLQ